MDVAVNAVTKLRPSRLERGSNAGVGDGTGLNSTNPATLRFAAGKGQTSSPQSSESSARRAGFGPDTPMPIVAAAWPLLGSRTVSPDVA